jgi:hypothetical protein
LSLMHKTLLHQSHHLHLWYFPACRNTHVKSFFAACASLSTNLHP